MKKGTRRVVTRPIPCFILAWYRADRLICRPSLRSEILFCYFFFFFAGFFFIWYLLPCERFLLRVRHVRADWLNGPYILGLPREIQPIIVVSAAEVKGNQTES